MSLDRELCRFVAKSLCIAANHPENKFGEGLGPDGVDWRGYIYSDEKLFIQRASSLGVQYLVVRHNEDNKTYFEAIVLDFGDVDYEDFIEKEGYDFTDSDKEIFSTFDICGIEVIEPFQAKSYQDFSKYTEKKLNELCKDFCSFYPCCYDNLKK